ncbi:Mitotic checkpoint serine/threonine-protein kinase BUB1 [Ananas comosus]|uniref:Mitotic checkpoint serine/threonine-protein kinase BUB1 n=1 Tax=Ananas comosus TaxID=4615 RepID=A0A199W6B0_ANACO|nr:Mitotic checkpoint serine/threonine-protein kinase BUB1 [Ananas comosus]
MTVYLFSKLLTCNATFRYWNVDLWKNLFSTLLNIPSNESDVPLLRSLRESFEEYICSNPQLITYKLKIELELDALVALSRPKPEA